MFVVSVAVPVVCNTGEGGTLEPKVRIPDSPQLEPEIGDIVPVPVACCFKGERGGASGRLEKKPRAVTVNGPPGKL